MGAVITGILGIVLIVFGIATLVVAGLTRSYLSTTTRRVLFFCLVVGVLLAMAAIVLEPLPPKPVATRQVCVMELIGPNVVTLDCVQVPATEEAKNGGLKS
jgi:hypothetical protein